MQDPYTERKGCFVYLLQEPVRPRVKPCSHADYFAAQCFHAGQLISVDTVRLPDVINEDKLDKNHERGDPFSFSTAYLRLSDGCGWLPQASSGKLLAQQIPVHAGLWKYYIDNQPVGQALRRHPIDSSEMHMTETGSMDQTPIVYAPMQLVYCDRKVTHPSTGVSWYRVQGTHDGWIVDRRINSSVNLLVPATKVQTGLFAFVALRSLSIRNLCSTADRAMTDQAVRQGQIVTGDLIRTWPSLRATPSETEDSDTENQPFDGPYVRLTDGSGWVFVRKEGTEVMRQIPILAVQAQLEVLNEPVGLSLRRFPIDEQDKIIDRARSFRPGTLLQADLQVTDEKGVRFYRILGTDGWLFDRRGSERVLRVLNEGEPCIEGAAAMPRQMIDVAVRKDGWSVDFVRGVVSTVDDLEEVQYHPNSHVICFETAEKVRIDVYCQTRTIGIKPNCGKGGSYACYRDCTPKLLQELLSRDLVDMMMDGALNGNDGEVFVDPVEFRDEQSRKRMEEEEEIRNHMLRVDKEIEDLLEKRLHYLTLIRKFDTARYTAALSTKKLAEERRGERMHCEPHVKSIYGVNDQEPVDLTMPLNQYVNKNPSGAESRLSRRSKCTRSSGRAFSTRSNSSKPVAERIDYLLELKSNETDDETDAPSRRHVSNAAAELSDDDTSPSHFNHDDISNGSSFDTGPNAESSYTDSEVESR